MRTVSEAATQWLALYVETARNRKGVQLAMQRAFDYLDPFMGRRPVGEVGPDDFRSYRLWLERRQLAPQSVRHILSDARALFGWAADSGIIERSRFPRGIMPRVQEAPPDRLADAEVAAVLGIGEPHAFIVRLGLATGMRWGEMCRAKAEHVSGSAIVVAHTKSGRLRRIPLPPDMLAELLARRGRLVSRSVHSPGAFNNLVRRRSGVERFHVHQLRHTFACRWLERGGTLASLQQLLGHGSVDTTQRYAKLSDEAVGREAERLYEGGAA